MQKENAEVHVVCTAENAARLEKMLKVRALRMEKSDLKKTIEELMRGLIEELQARERSVAEKMHMKDVVAVDEKQSEQVKQISVLVSALEGEVMNGQETRAHLNAM